MTVDRTNIRCKIAPICAGMFLSADDIISSAPSVQDLRSLVSLRDSELDFLYMAVNATICLFAFRSLVTLLYGWNSIVSIKATHRIGCGGGLFNNMLGYSSSSAIIHVPRTPSCVSDPPSDASF